MSTRRSAALAAAVAAVLALTACGGSDPTSQPAPSAPSSTPAAPSGGRTGGTGATPVVPELPQVNSSVVATLQQVLDARATAIVDGDREAFLSGLSDSPALRTVEGGYFDNLAQLPLSSVSYRLVPASLVRKDDSYWGVVEVDLQLTSYDAVPVRTVDRFRFLRDGEFGAGPDADPDSRSFVVGSTTDEEWEAANLPSQQPWDIEPIRVREGAGVLGIFDVADRRERAGIVASVERGILDVSGRVPFDEWGQQAVVYALSDPTFLDSLDDVPGGNPEALDGVAFTVPAGTDGATVAATRFALSPQLLPLASARRVDPELDRLVRHELVHVAVGTHDDGAPVWLSEGIAEWVSVQADPPANRDVPQEAVAAARRGIDTMPTDADFNGEAADVNYAVAWWVCEWLVKTYGADAPWTVLEAFELRAGEDDRAVVRDLLGLSVDQLARRGGQLLAATYSPTPTPDPTTTPPSSSSPQSSPSPSSLPTRLPSSLPSPPSDYVIID